MAEPTPSDEVLMAAFQDGDHTAFRTLAERYNTRMYRFALRYVRSDSLAQELVQDLFLRTVKYRETYKRYAAMAPWLFSILRNLCIDTLRRERLRKTDSLDRSLSDDGPTLLDQVASSQATSDIQLENHHFSKALQDALMALPAEQREVFLLRELEDLRFRDIAGILNIPEGTVKSRMRYALEGLRAHLSEWADPS